APRLRLMVSGPADEPTEMPAPPAPPLAPAPKFNRFPPAPPLPPSTPAAPIVSDEVPVPRYEIPAPPGPPSPPPPTALLKPVPPPAAVPGLHRCQDCCRYVLPGESNPNPSGSARSRETLTPTALEPPAPPWPPFDGLLSAPTLPLPVTTSP